MENAPHRENAELALRLAKIAELLEAQGANPFRVNAYRNAAESVRACSEPVSDLFAREGIEGIDRLPGIGASIASLVREYVRSGRISLLERLEGEVSAEDVLGSVPGIGPGLARRIHTELDIETLEALECACLDGSLAALRGFGPRRVAAIAAAVGALLGGRARARARGEDEPDARRPSVAAVLSVDEEYRRRAQAGDLARIAPRRFNPKGTAWLPILHTEREGWSFTALYSNTARAHELGRTHDWVVIYADRDGRHDQCTVVSERHGKETRRVVRGRN